MTQEEIRTAIKARGLRMAIHRETGGGGRTVLVAYLSHHGRGQKKVYLGFLSVLSGLSEEQLKARIAEKASKL